MEFDQVPRKADMADRTLRQNMEVEDDFCLYSTKLIDPNSTKDFNRENEIWHSNLAVEGKDPVNPEISKSNFLFNSLLCFFLSCLVPYISVLDVISLV